MNLIFKLTLIVTFAFYFIFSTTQAHSQEVLESKQFKLFLINETKEDLLSPTPKPIRYSLSKQEYDEFQKNGLITRPLGEQKKLQVQFGSLRTKLDQNGAYQDIPIRSISDVTAKIQNRQDNAVQVLYKDEYKDARYTSNSAPSNSFFLHFLRKSNLQVEKLNKDTVYVFIQNPNE